MNKKNPNLSAEQKLVMFEDGTEPPGTSKLNNEKRKGSYRTGTEFITGEKARANHAKIPTNTTRHG